MRKKTFHKTCWLKYLVAGLLMLQALSCKKFLQVQPRDYMFEEETFSTPKGVQSALNGIYQSLSDSVLYGNLLTMTATENMAQYYYSNASPFSNHFSGFMYILGAAKSGLSSIWNQSYKTILGINNFCERLEAPSFHVISARDRRWMLGEAYAIRAFLHFDLLRLYGPVYPVAPGDPAIPYVRKVVREAQPQLAASDVVLEVIRDLDSALVFLEADPVRIKGPDWTTVSTPGQSVDYFSNRQRRMNYFAVKALAARVLLYAGKKSEAWQMVQSVLMEQEAFFPWAKEADYSKDPLLTSESFFGIENRKMYDHYRQQFSPLLSDALIQTPTPARLNGIYNPDSKDLRLKYWFKVGVEGDKSYKVFIKFSNANVSESAIRYYQPMIRKSELYLIAAETAPGLEQGFFYLNTLRVNKGLPPVTYQAGSTTAELLEGIRNEYQREFIGDGQLFFMFKRFNLRQIPSISGVGNITMEVNKYMPPIPQEEFYYR